MEAVAQFFWGGEGGGEVVFRKSEVEQYVHLKK